MKKKELRLALVCCGGLSLVLYMQGVIKEFLKLTRASKAYHSIDDPERRQVETFARTAGNDGRERDTEAIYFSLLQAVGRDLDLRIIVDSIGGWYQRYHSRACPRARPFNRPLARQVA